VTEHAHALSIITRAYCQYKYDITVRPKQILFSGVSLSVCVFVRAKTENY